MRRRLYFLASKMRGRAPPFVLMYHRVHRSAIDPWDLSVAPEFFAQHIEIIRRYYRATTLLDVANGNAPDRAIAITFDDGYIDILLNAKPVLEKYECPATVFIPTGLIGQKRDFWWDELARLVFEAETVPAELTVSVGGDILTLETSSLGGHGRPNRREDVHRRLWDWLLPLDHKTRLICLDQIAEQVKVSNCGRAENRAVDASELRDLSTELIDIGAHTVTHPALPNLNAEQQHQEVLQSRRTCEEILGRPPMSFAYPNGRYNAESIKAVRDAGFSLACTVHAAPVTAWSRPLELPRIQVKNWDGDEFSRRLARHFIDQ